MSAAETIAAPTPRNMTRRSSEQVDETKTVAQDTTPYTPTPIDMGDQIGGESEEHSHLIFAFLRQPRLRPSRRLLHCMM